jgi:CheY-like chemotaxis protein
VKVHSAGPNQGAEFTLRLPLHIPHQSPAPSQQAEPPTASSPPPCRLLVVDDNRDAADTLAMLLESQGHQVQVAYDGAGALHKAASNPPDVVFLDLGMPVMDGYAVAQQMRTTPGLEGTILVALTGWGQARDRQRTAEAGFHHHLVKPPEPGEVERLLETCVREKTIASRAAQ